MPMLLGTSPWDDTFFVIMSPAFRLPALRRPALLPRHSPTASGSSSPNTTYSMAPEAKLSAAESAAGPSVPTQKPRMAPKTVGAPVTAARDAALHHCVPPAVSGAATAIPSGTLCNPITAAITQPLPASPDAKAAPITIPSGTLCRAMAAAITMPARISSPRRPPSPSRPGRQDRHALSPAVIKKPVSTPAAVSGRCP